MMKDSPSDLSADLLKPARRVRPNAKRGRIPPSGVVKSKAKKPRRNNTLHTAVAPNVHVDPGRDPASLTACHTLKISTHQVRCSCGKFLARVVNGKAYIPPRRKREE